LHDDENDLFQAYQAGRGGASIDSSASPFDALIAMDIEPHHARTWVITVGGMHYQSKGGAVIAGIPLDNQVNTIGLNQAPAYLKMQYGTQKAFEEVLFDYPWGGLTFQVSAAMVRLYAPTTFDATPPQIPPKLSAFISGKHARGIATQRLTYTQSAVNVGALGVVSWYAPARAVGYRPFQIALVAGAVSTVALQQTLGNSTAIQIDAAAFAADGTGSIQGAGWFRLNQRSQAVALTNNDPVNLRQYGMAWLLDVA
jgi:hypothetical protein